jgi:outer membrane protein assembly factor BamD (BamD/ComL family)
MSISGIANTALNALFSATQSAQNGQGQFQQIQSEFQQLGQDLQAGNLTQAQQDYATLSQNFTPTQSGPTTVATTTDAATNSNSNSIAQAFEALSQNLENGNIAGAQQSYATIQQDFQQQQHHGTGEIHHHHHGGGQGNQVSQALSSLSSALQAGNLSSAQSAFATLQQDLEQQFGGGASGNASATSSTAANTTSAQSNGLSVTA